VNATIRKLAASLLALMAGGPSLSAAQAAGAAPVGPGDPNAAVPAVEYRSPFARYRPLGEVTTGPWRAVNEEVGRIGGWKAYAREAQEAARASPPPEGARAPATSDNPPAKAK